MVAQAADLDEELFGACMRRFLYIRCYDSFEFLASLKTMRYQLQKESEAHGGGVHFLMIDSISAFYWVDRSSKPLAQLGDNRKHISLQSLAETVVQEIRKLLQVQPMLVLATKADMFGNASTNELKRTTRKWPLHDTLDSRTSSRTTKDQLYREYMPSVWQSFVTHRILLHISGENFAGEHRELLPIYTSEWVLPSLNFLDKFTVRDEGIFMVS